MPVTLSKHHGLGNDFLVLLDMDGTHPIDGATTRALCDRHRGIGADGLIRGSQGSQGADLTFELRNADGSPAEMSGNGMRCLAQAAVMAGLVGKDFTVATPAGVRRVRTRPSEDPGVLWSSVDMGAAKVMGEPDRCNVGHGQLRVDMGNPHLVVLGPDPRTVDVATLGPDLETSVPGGQNVEFVTLGPGPDEITLRVWERGVGETMACGTGACASAVALHHWSRVGAKVTVHQLGGDAEVDLTGDTVVLTGPSQYIARIELP
jgi:diaminopimelate epimerase